METTWIELYDYQTRHTFYVNQKTDKWRKDKPADALILKADPEGVWSIRNDESQMSLYYNSKTMKWSQHPPSPSCKVVSLSHLVKRPSMRRFIYLPPVSFNQKFMGQDQMIKWKHGDASDNQNDNIISQQTTSAIGHTSDQKRSSLPITKNEASQSSVSPKIKKQGSLLQKSKSSIESTFQAKISPQSFKKRQATAFLPPLSIARQNQHDRYLTNAQDTSTTHVQYRRPCTSPKNQYNAPWIYSPPSPLSLVTSSSSSSSPVSPPSMTPLSPLSPLSPHSQLNNTFDTNRIYVFDNYAAKHFANHKRGLFIRTPISSTIMAQWTKDSITKPLLRSTDKKHTKDATECFKKLQMIMGDRPRKSHGRITKGDDVTDIQSILTMGITGGQQICDEIYAQLCKQLNHNPGSTSSQNGWELLSVLCSTIPPSNELALYIIQLLHDHHHPQTPPATFSATASLDNNPSPSIHSYLSLKVRRICQKGAHGKVPCKAEIQLDRMAIFQQQQNMDECGSDRAISTMVFGTPLDTIMENQQRLHDITSTHKRWRHLKIPRIVPFLIQAIRQLGGHRTQGIFRIAGLADMVTSLRLQIENGLYLGDDSQSGGGLDLEVCCGDPNVPASLLRLWLRELPAPLIPVEYYDRCINHSSDLVSVMMIVDGIPDVNRRVLMYIIGFIQEYLSPQVCQRTLMTVNNLAMVFAPNFLRGPLSDNLVLALHKSKYEQLFVKTLLLGPKVDMDHQLYD